MTYTSTEQPEALRLVEWIESDMSCDGDADIVAELLRQHARIEELEEQLSAIGAGGVEPLRKQAEDGWIQDGPLLYRLTDERRPRNRDEINVTMANGSRTEEARTRRASELLHAIRAAIRHAQVVPDEVKKLRDELAEETEAAENWRGLALQFDNHRMQAIGHLKAVTNPAACFDKYKAAKAFLSAPPLSGEEVLAQRLAELATTPATVDMGISMSESAAPKMRPEAWLATFRPKGMLSSHSVAGTNLEELKRSVPSDSKFKPLYAQPSRESGHE